MKQGDLVYLIYNGDVLPGVVSRIERNLYRVAVEVNGPLFLWRCHSDIYRQGKALELALRAAAGEVL